MKIIDDISALANHIISNIHAQDERAKKEVSVNALISQLRTNYSSLVSLNARYQKLRAKKGSEVNKLISQLVNEYSSGASPELSQIAEILENKIAQLERRIAAPCCEQHAEEIAAISQKYEQEIKELSERYSRELEELSEGQKDLNDKIINMEASYSPRGLSPERHYVLDTSVIIQTPQIIEELLFRKYRTYIPLSVLKELDNLKNSNDPEIEDIARKASAYIYTHAETGNAESGGRFRPIARKSTYLYICDRYEQVDELASRADNMIIGTAIWLKMALSGKTRFRDRNNFIINEMKPCIGTHDQLILLTADTNMRFAAEKNGIIAKVWKKT